MFDTNREPIDQAAIDLEVKHGSTKLSPFDFIGAIDQKRLMDFSQDWVEKQYDPFMVNRGYLQAQRTVGVAAMMDQFNNLDKKMQFDFYWNVLPKSSSFNRWTKQDKENEEKIALLKQVYGISRAKCLEVLPLITDWDVLAQRVFQGGRK